MITELATTIYDTITLALTGVTENIFYRHVPDYTNYSDFQVIYDFTATDFPETLDNHKLNKYSCVITIFIKPEDEAELYGIEKKIKTGFSNLVDDHVKAVHIVNTDKTYNELLDVFEKKINITLTYVD